MRTGIKKVQIIKLSDLKDSNDPGMEQGVEVVYSDGEFEFRAGKAFEEVDCNVHFSNLTITDQSSNVSMFSYLANMRIDTRGKYLDYIKRYGNHALIVLLTSIEDTVYQLGTSYNPVYLRTNIQTDYLKGEHAGTTMEVEWIFPVVHVLRDVHNEEGYCIVLNTLNESVGTEVNGDIIVGNSRLEIKNTEGAILYTKEVVAERDDETTIQDSKHTVKNQDGDTLLEANILAEGNKTSEIWAKDYRPLIFKYDTRLSGDNTIELRNTGNYEKHITIKDMQGDILEEYWTTDSNVINTNHQVGEYYVEIRQRAGNYYSSNINTITNQRATLTEIVQFGDVIWDVGDLNYLYRRCGELIITAKDVMQFRETGDITRAKYAFEMIKGVAETTWLEQFPWGRVQVDANRFFFNTPNFAKDTLELDFKDADILDIGNFLSAYQIGGSNGIQTLIIKNMETCVNMTGNIISSYDWTNGMQKVIFQGLQVSQNMTVWRPTDPVNIMLFFLNLGDRTGETQSTITIRTQEWDLLTQEQKDVVEDILVNKNWALALN